LDKEEFALLDEHVEFVVVFLLECKGSSEATQSEVLGRWEP